MDVAQNNRWHAGVALIEIPFPRCRSGTRRNGNIYFMSQHPSLRASNSLGAKRNVLKRFERAALLKKRGQWKDGDRITGLRKTKPDE